MATPAYHIFYGKYPDQTDNEIPNTQIKNVDGLQFRIEPGKPAEPKVDGVSFTLENLNPDGTERYDEAWFDAQSRSQAQGGTFPNQLFFSIELETGAKFAGVLKSKSYGPFRATVDIHCQSLLALVSDNNLSMLKAFELQNCEANIRNECRSDPPAGYGNDFPCPVDLNGNDLVQEQTYWIVEQQLSGSGYPEIEHTDLLLHFFGVDRISDPAAGDFGSYLTGNINAFVKIGENTILTTISLEVSKQPYQGKYQAYIALSVYQAKNGNVQLPDRLILERGRFFADDKGTDFTEFQKYTVTLLEPDRGYDPDIILKEADMPSVQFMFGCPVAQQNGKMQILDASTSSDVFDLVKTTTNALASHLFDTYYNNSPDNIDLTKQNSPATYAFWGDLGMFGWVGQSTGDVMVNMATLTNCYVFMNSSGKIVYQDRLLHGDYLPGALPPGSFQVDLADIRPLGSQEDGHGFDSYTISYKDRVEIDNIESDAEKKVAVDAGGIRQKPALRNTDLSVQAYRTQNLGVPATQNGLPLFRRSPEDAGFGVSGLSLDDFILTAPDQAQNFAASWSYPVQLWKIEWDMPRYPQARIGGYFWVDWGTEKRVYFIRDITHDADALTHKMEVQKVGVWNG